MPRPPEGQAPRALLLDAAGTLLSLAEPVGVTYAHKARQHGLRLEPSQAERAFRVAMTDPQRGPMEGDGRAFWADVVARTTGSEDPDLFQDLYAWYAAPPAWRVVPGWKSTVQSLAQRGIPSALVSNWDTRLRPLLTALGVSSWLPVQLISGEEGVEKPEAELFHRACDQLGVAPSEALMVGDSRRNDVVGAQEAGLQALHWGTVLQAPRDLLPLFEVTR